MRTFLKIFLAGILLSAISLTFAAPAKKAWIPDWKQTSAINIARAGTASVRVKDKIYLIGGVVDRKFLTTTEYAQIQEDGSLGPWQFGPTMNEERGFTSATVHGDYVYVVGGGNGSYGHNLLSTVERARIQPDGTLGQWEKEKNRMVVGRRCSKILTTDKALYSFGGFGGVLLDSVESAEWQPDGSLGEWKLDAQVMTIPRYVNSVKKSGDVFFVLGGHDQTKGVGITDVEWSRPAADGTLQKWQATTPMQQGRYGFLTALYGNYMYAIGGLSGAEYLDTIERTVVGADGQLQTWQLTTPLDQPRANFGVIDFNDRLYIIGGSNHDGFISSVIFAERNENGDIGYWGSAEEEKAAKARIAEREALKANLPNEGLIKEVSQTKDYTYLLVESKTDGLVWLAAPKLNDINAGDTLGYSKGVRMSNFRSKELDRYFPLVLFVSQARKK